MIYTVHVHVHNYIKKVIDNNKGHNEETCIYMYIVYNYYTKT